MSAMAHHETDIILGEVHHGRVEVGPLIKGVRDDADGEGGRRLFMMFWLALKLWRTIATHTAAAAGRIVKSLPRRTTAASSLRRSWR